MDDDSLAVTRKALVAGGTMVFVGFMLCILFWEKRAAPGQSIVPVLGWITLVLGVAAMAGAAETRDDRVNLLLMLVSFSASLLGVLVYGFGLVFTRGNEVLDIDVAFDLVQRGPGLILIGFVLGTGASARLAWDLVGENVPERLGKKPRGATNSDDTKPCPHCGNMVPQYAAACQNCKTIFPPDA